MNQYHTLIYLFLLQFNDWLNDRYRVQTTKSKMFLTSV